MKGKNVFSILILSVGSVATVGAHSMLALSDYTPVDTRNPEIRFFVPDVYMDSSTLTVVDTQNPEIRFFVSDVYTSISGLTDVDTRNPEARPFVSGGRTFISGLMGVDTRDYTLTVISEEGLPEPSVGIHSGYCWHSAVTGSVDSVVIVGRTNYLSTGWSGQGMDQVAGISNFTGRILLTEPDSVLTWNWLARRLYELLVENGGGDGLYMFGQTVSISSDSPEAGYEFTSWIVSPEGYAGRLGNNAAVTSFMMPEADVTLVPTYTQWDADLDILPDSWEQAIVDADPNDAIQSLADVLPGGDFDGDGIENVFEYAFDGNIETNEGLFMIRMVDGRPVLEIPEQTTDSIKYMDIIVECSVDLENWNIPVAPWQEAAPAPAGKDWYETQSATNQAYFILRALPKSN